MLNNYRFKFGESYEIDIMWSESTDDLAKFLVDSEDINPPTKRIILPGGGSVFPLYGAFEKKDLTAFHFAISDERVVPIEHDDSNVGNIKRKFPKLFEHFKIWNDSDQLESLKTFIDGQFVLVLGAGNDGHIASLFPENDFKSSTPYVVHGQPDNAGQKRLSISFDAIQKAKSIVFWLTGNSKMNLKQFFTDFDRSKPLIDCICTALDNKTPVKIYSDQKFLKTLCN